MLNEAAGVLQRWFRVKLPNAGLLRKILCIGRSSLAKKQQTREKSAAVIQAVLRRFMVTKRIRKWASAATKLQAFARTHAASRSYYRLLQQRHTSGVRICAWWRALKDLRAFRKKKMCSIRIRQEWRRFQRTRQWRNILLASKDENKAESGCYNTGTHAATFHFHYI